MVHGSGRLDSDSSGVGAGEGCFRYEQACAGSLVVVSCVWTLMWIPVLFCRRRYLSRECGLRV